VSQICATDFPLYTTATLAEFVGAWCACARANAKASALYGGCTRPVRRVLEASMTRPRRTTKAYSPRWRC